MLIKEDLYRDISVLFSIFVYAKGINTVERFQPYLRWVSLSIIMNLSYCT